jgi:hypothetical protein
MGAPDGGRRCRPFLSMPRQRIRSRGRPCRRCLAMQRQRSHHRGHLCRPYLIMRRQHIRSSGLRPPHITHHKCQHIRNSNLRPPHITHRKWQHISNKTCPLRLTSKYRCQSITSNSIYNHNRESPPCRTKRRSRSARHLTRLRASTRSPPTHSPREILDKRGWVTAVTMRNYPPPGPHPSRAEGRSPIRFPRRVLRWGTPALWRMAVVLLHTPRNRRLLRHRSMQPTRLTPSNSRARLATAHHRSPLESQLLTPGQLSEEGYRDLADVLALGGGPHKIHSNLINLLCEAWP